MARRNRRPDGFPKITLRNISRAEPKFFGWRVLIKRRKQYQHQHFADGPDGPFESLRRAIVWRNEVWMKVGPPSRISVNGKNARSSSGILGVTREVRRTSSGSIVEVWAGGWQDVDKKNRRKCFSIDKYGEADAKARAVAARTAGVAEADKQRHRRWLDMLHMQNKMLRGA